MDYIVKILPTAINDIQEIYNYIAFELKSVINAEKTISKIRTEIENLKTFPNGFRLYPKEPWHSRKLRFTPIGNYIVFFIANDIKLEVNVLRVLYGRIDFSKVWT